MPRSIVSVGYCSAQADAILLPTGILQLSVARAANGMAAPKAIASQTSGLALHQRTPGRRAARPAEIVPPGSNSAREVNRPADTVPPRRNPASQVDDVARRNPFPQAASPLSASVLLGQLARHLGEYDEACPSSVAADSDASATQQPVTLRRELLGFEPRSRSASPSIEVESAVSSPISWAGESRSSAGLSSPERPLARRALPRSGSSSPGFEAFGNGICERLDHVVSQALAARAHHGSDTRVSQRQPPGDYTCTARKPLPATTLAWPENRSLNSKPFPATLEQFLNDSSSDEQGASREKQRSVAPKVRCQSTVARQSSGSASSTRIANSDSSVARQSFGSSPTQLPTFSFPAAELASAISADAERDVVATVGVDTAVQEVATQVVTTTSATTILFPEVEDDCRRGDSSPQGDSSKGSTFHAIFHEVETDRAALHEKCKRLEEEAVQRDHEAALREDRLLQLETEHSQTLALVKSLDAENYAFATEIKRRQEAAIEQEKIECVVCLSESAVYAAVPCGHLALCQGCSSDPSRPVRTCHVCRASVTQLIRIYRA